MDEFCPDDLEENNNEKKNNDDNKNENLSEKLKEFQYILVNGAEDNNRMYSRGPVFSIWDDKEDYQHFFIIKIRIYYHIGKYVMERFHFYVDSISGNVYIDEDINNIFSWLKKYPESFSFYTKDISPRFNIFTTSKEIIEKYIKDKTKFMQEY